MDVPATVKKEEDEPGYNPDTDVAPAAASVAPETSVLDSHLAADDFIDRLKFIKMKGGDGDGSKVWPALTFISNKELQDAVIKDLEGHYFGNLTHLRSKITRYLYGQDNKVGIAYLFGRKTLRRSLVALQSEDDVQDFHTYWEVFKEKFKSDGEFIHALDVAMARIVERDSDDDTVSCPRSPASPTKQTTNQGAVKTEEEVVEITDSPDAVGASINAGIADDNSSQKSTYGEKAANNGNGEEVVAEHKNQSNQSTLSEEKSRHEGGEGLADLDQSKPTKAAVGKKRKVVEGGEAIGKKKQGKSQMAKAKKSAASIVTPGKAKQASDEEISKTIMDTKYDLYWVISNTKAWQLLESKFGIRNVDNKYYLPSQPDPIVGLAALRIDLCANGLPQCTGLLSLGDKIDIARWVRYAHVAGLEDGQTICPDNLGKPINTFMNGWSILVTKFGCKYSSGMYTVPTAPSGKEKKVFDHCPDLESHFARFGIQCLPDNIPEETLSKKDRLSLEIYNAAPTFEAVNTL